LGGLESCGLDKENHQKFVVLGRKANWDVRATYFGYHGGYMGSMAKAGANAQQVFR